MWGRRPASLAALSSLRNPHASGSQQASRDCRRGFGHVVDGGERLVSLLRKIGSEAVVDINQALLCHSLDVIGQVGSPPSAAETASHALLGSCPAWQLPVKVSGQGLCLCCSDFDCVRL